jgi:PadR family transcriptional regulator, regulatory protein PadR
MGNFQPLLTDPDNSCARARQTHHFATTRGESAARKVAWSNHGWCPLGQRLTDPRSGISLTFDIECRYDQPVMKSDVLQGTLDLLVLRTLELRPLHGVGVSDRIEQVTRGIFVVGPGSLFPALHRLAEKGWIKGQWGELESGRRVKVYSLTRSGRAQLAQEKRNWQRVFIAMNQVLTEDK